MPIRMYKNPSQLQEIGSLDGEKLIFEVCPENQNEKPKLHVFVRKHFRLFQLRGQPVDRNLIGVESAEDTYRQNIFLSKDLHNQITVPANGLRSEVPGLFVRNFDDKV